ncbi:hypothetical protein FFLO_04178 [Filobasidium floriforme]|uniref:Phospholipid:diacylglycerol acyltransferase n=1 Tax=Filobasidium floriforme TaxID=5210 RepID=A0A8K0JPN8_9TREE|nr:hypothetical protein FFLO_04178 [Filobasidium floriforme]
MSRFVDGNAFSVLSVDKTEGGQTPGTRKRNKQGKHAPKGKEVSEPVHERERSSSKQREATEKVLKVSKPSNQPVQQIVGHVKQESTATKSKSVPPSERLTTSSHEPRPKKNKSKSATTWTSWARGRRFAFSSGIAIGLAFSAYQFAPQTLPPDLMSLLSGSKANAGFMSSWFQDTTNPFPSMNLEGWGFDWDWRDLANNLSVVEQTRKAFNSKEFSPAEELIAKEPGIGAHYPVILIPGVSLNGLEQWSASKVAKGSFRKRLWSTTQMVSAVLADRKAWMEALSLDPVTGLDPPNHRVRAAQGLDAASEFIQGYWVWQRVIENLAAIGYDPLSMEMASYDWRLSYHNLEVRDAFFTRLRDRIEQNKRITGRKTVLISHSMGGSVVNFFLKWVEAADDAEGFRCGNRDDRWVDQHIEAHAGIASTLLGVTKSMTAFLSGDLKDTIELHPAASWVLEKFFSRKERANLFHKWPGSASMWMKGGDRIWGTHDSAPDDPANCTGDTHGRFFSFRQTSDSGPSRSHEPKDSEMDAEHIQPNLTMNDAGIYTLLHTPPDFQRMYHSNYSNGFENDVKILQENAKDHRKWSNPLEVQLPNAPSMKQYCFYGYGKPTERSYFYMQGQFEHDEIATQGDDAQCTPDELQRMVNGSAITCRKPLDMPMARKNWIDTEVNAEGSVPEVRRGVKFGMGDGTVPLMSLGAMCVKGWKDDRWNPARMPIITHEFKHEPEGLDPRGGPKSADHIDILGNHELITAVLRIAAGLGDTVEEKIVSPINEVANRIDWDS